MKSPAATPEQRVKDTEENVPEEVWGFIAATLKEGLKWLRESLLEDEVATKVLARRYERSPQRQGYRGGHYLRDLVTRYRLVDGLRVPRLAQGPGGFHLFDQYERRRSDVDGAIGRLSPKASRLWRLPPGGEHPPPQGHRQGDLRPGG